MRYARRRRLALAAATAVVAAAVLMLPRAAPAEESPPPVKRRPNVILIMTDDQGYGDLGCHGNRQIRTPNLDRLAAQGVELTRFYNCPVCAPTRANLMTGRYCYRTGVWATWQGGEAMRSDEVTLAEMLAAAGYRTAIFGKWHLGEVYPWLPTEQGFQDGLYVRTSGVGSFNTTCERRLQPVRTEGYLTDVLTRAAIEFVERHRREPFFVYLPYPAVHVPHQAPERLVEPYLAMGLERKVATLYAMITSIDENVGRLLEKLDSLELAGDTVVLFLSDNGMGQPLRYNCNLRGHKGQVYEGGIRVPLFARWPGKWPPGRKIDAVAANIDLFPTIAEICGLPIPQGVKLDGVSLAPLLSGRSDALPDRTLFFHNQNHRRPQPYPNGAARTARYKLVDGKALFDLIEDPLEKRDVAAEHPEVVAGLRRQYEAWWKEVSSERGLVPPPNPVGYAQENPAILLAWHATGGGNVKLACGYTGEGERFIAWLSGWTALGDSVRWDLDVVRDGRYRVIAHYRCPEPDAGSRIRITAGDSSDEAEVLSLEGNVEGGKWIRRALGTVELKQGKTTLSIRALSKPGKTVMEIERLLLERLD